MKTIKKLIFALLAAVIVLSSFASCGAPSEPDPTDDPLADKFYDELTEKYSEPDIENRTELRWWMASGSHTDQTLEEEINAIYDAGFRGIELCQLSKAGINEKEYGFGSKQWEHDFKLVLNKTLDLGMTVGLTVGTNWNTANVPGLDPDSQAANRCLYYSSETISGGDTRSGEIPYDSSLLKNKASFVAAYAYKKATATGTGSAIEVESQIIELTDSVRLNSDNKTGTLEWTAPDDGDYIILYYWQQGTWQKSSPSVKPSYCVNYFDIRGFNALKEYWEENILNDPVLNEKIKEGDVQVFMDSLEYNFGYGAFSEDNKNFMHWSENFAEEFNERKGYDFTPYALLAFGLPEPKGINGTNVPKEYGTFNLTDAEEAQRILNDYHDVLTELYRENLLDPLREWLHGYGIKLRAQISYGKYLEISEPSLSVDYPEIENLNQANQVDMYRLWTGAAHLENKVLSSETSALVGYSYAYDYQKLMQEAYTLYSAGVSRINWHIWTSQWVKDSVSVDWPGFQNLSDFNVFSTREPGYSEYSEFNNHLGRVQQLLREGKSRTDIGIIHVKYGEKIFAPSSSARQEHQNYLLRHETIPSYFPSLKLQDNGYTYDYFSPEAFNSESVYFNEETQTLELAGYKALVLYEKWLSLEGAKKILEFAKQGLKIVVLDGAAVTTPYNDGKDDELAEIMRELKSLPIVKCVATADETLNALEQLGVRPYAEFEENYQLLTQVRQDGDNMYLYVYNYCNDEYCGSDHKSGMGHGTEINTEISIDGTFKPYRIDAWSGEVTEVGQYRVENGKTIIPINLEYGNVALYAFEKTDEATRHITDTDARYVYVNDSTLITRDTVSGAHFAVLNDGKRIDYNVSVPQMYSIENWNLTVESWMPGEEITRTETVDGVTTTEHTYTTQKTPITVELSSLKTWDKIPEVGKAVSGKGFYTSEFEWDGNADGAYLDLGDVVQSLQVYVNGIKTDDLNMNECIVDIGGLLKKGTNKIEIIYSSNLTNVQLDRGVIKEANNVMKWQGYDIHYRSYGISQAVIIPYVETHIDY